MPKSVKQTLKSSFLENRAPGDKSVVPVGTNKLPAKKIFRERDKYRNSYPLGVQPLDTFEGFNWLYGRVNHDMIPVFVAEDHLKQILTPVGTMFVLDFVADAFEDLKNYLAKAVQISAIDMRGSVFKDLNATLAWDTSVSIHTVYNKYIEHTYELFVGTYLTTGARYKEIDNFDDFVKHFLNFVTRMAYYSPITRIGFITSHHMNPRSSALVIELYEGDHQDDYGKYAGFIRDNNFTAYKRTCERHGFLVDKNAPWRMFADITNPYMQDKMIRRDVSSEKNMFASRFLKASDYEIENLRVRLFQMYDLYLKQSPDYTALKLGPRGVVPVVEHRQKMTLDEMFEKYDDAYWIRMLVYLRAVETRKNYDQREFDQMVEQALNYYNYIGMHKVIEWVDENFKHTSDEIAKNTKEIILTEEQLCDTLQYEPFVKPNISFNATFKF